VTLAHGHSVLAILSWSSTVTDGGGRTVVGSYLTVAPAAGGKSQTLPLEAGLGNIGELDVMAWSVDLPR
jgi:hypothetical protein